MIEVGTSGGSRALVIRATGVLTDADYKNVLTPALDRAFADSGKLNALVLLDGFAGWEPAAALDDIVYGLKHRGDFQRMAIVGGPRWTAIAVRFGAFIMSGEMRAYPSGQLKEACEWIGAPIPKV